MHNDKKHPDPSDLSLSMHLGDLSNYFSSPLTPQLLLTFSCPWFNFSCSPELITPATLAFFLWLYHTKLPSCIRVFLDFALPRILSLRSTTQSSYAHLLPSINSHRDFLSLSKVPYSLVAHHLIAILSIILNYTAYLLNYFLSWATPHTDYMFP